MNDKLKSISGVTTLFFIGAVFILFLNKNGLPNFFFETQNKSESKLSLPVNAIDSFYCKTMDVYYRMIKNDPDFERRLRELEIFTKNYIKNYAPRDRNIVKIPVVVHIVYNTPEQNISNAIVQSQIDVLNIDFRRLNADTVNTPVPFKPLGGDSQIEFVLAKRDPMGNPSIGITRTQTSMLIFEPNDNMKFTALGGHDIWNRDKYMNIWVCNLNFQGGYSQFPGGDSATDGNVIKYTVFGTIGAVIPGYTKGRITTHEIGHWFNLRHIWGDTICGDDFVFDTPTQETMNSSCPSFPHITCSNGPNGDMYMNYMDYTVDDCKNMYTIGQSNRMNACLSSVRSSLLTSDGGNPVSGVPIAHFRSNKMTVIPGQSINFYDESGGIPLSWQWTFVGGTPSTSNLQNPSVVYQNSGLYSVKLKVINSYGMDSVNYINYVKVLGVNLSAFLVVYPPAYTFINTSLSDSSMNTFTWTKSSLHSSIRYKWKIRKYGASGEIPYYSNNNGSDSLISLRNSLLDSIAMGFGGSSDTVTCIWRVYAYNGLDSLLSQNQLVVYLIRQTVGVKAISLSYPDKFELSQNYPNPFNPTTKIKFALPNDYVAKLIVYDGIGREIETLVNEQLKAGNYEVNWNAKNYPSGVYFYKLFAGEFSHTNKMVLLK